MPETNLTDLEPKILWSHFAHICSIPHPSHHEAKLANYVKEFGEQLGLATSIDKLNNVIIKKPATKGMENRATIILQAHLDMVPQKNNDTPHNFETDPIEAYIDGEFVTAKGTTLGADNGIGIATIMAILESKDITHGPIEALFTIDEEDGMEGAAAIQPEALSGKILLNLDTEDEAEIDIGCAGGQYTHATLPYATEPTPNDSTALEIKLLGLHGGHSGVDIILERGNANKILNRLLWETQTTFDVRLASFNGGNLPNAIPREANAVITIPSTMTENFTTFTTEFCNTIKNELGSIDPDLTITVQKTSLPDKVFTHASQDAFLKAIYCCPDGVIHMSKDIPGLVETSTNLAAVNTNAHNINIKTLQRGAIASLKFDTATMVKLVFELAGGTAEHTGSYPGWQPNINSKILAIVKKLYIETFNSEPKIQAIHAGLECALFKKNSPDLDMISFGPTIMHAHSPDEKVSIPSVKRFWSFLLKILTAIPEE